MKKCIICETILNGNQSKYCSNNCKQKGHWENKKTQRNSYHSQTIRSYKRKLKLVEMSGGKCEICGYNKNLSVLQFHHINPVDKIFKLDARQLSNTKWETILNEHAKCQLLCANCHSELHNPEMEFDKILKILTNN